MKMKWDTLVLVAAAGLLIVSVGARGVVSHQRHAALADRQVALRAGDTIPDLANELPGATPGRAVLVMFFTAECPWCRVSVPRWNALADSALAHGIEVRAVSLSDSASTAAMIRQTGFRVVPAHAPDAKIAIARWRVVRVPYTVVLAPDHRVAASWVGLVDSTTASQIHFYLR